MDMLIDPGDPGHRNPVVLAAFILCQLDHVAGVSVINRGKLPTVRAHHWHVRLDLGGVNSRCGSHEDDLQTAGRFAHARCVAEGVPRRGRNVAWRTLALIVQEATHVPVLIAQARALPGWRARMPYGYAAQPCTPGHVAARSSPGYAAPRPGVACATLTGCGPSATLKRR